MQAIQSSKNKRIKNALQLHRSRGRKKQGRIIIFGQREIGRAIANGIQPDEFFICEDYLGGGGEGFVQKYSEVVGRDVTAQTFGLPKDLFDTLAYGDRGDGVVLTAIRPDTSLDAISVDGLCDRSVGADVDSNFKSEQEIGSNLFVVVLEGVEKPGNLGGIIRSADGSGVAAVLIANPLTDPFHPNSIRNSCGATFNVPIAIGSNQEIQNWLAANAFDVFVASPESGANFHSVDLTGRTGVVLGNEANGVSADWRSEQHRLLGLPMLGIADSLNVSVTAAVVMYESLRQRTNG